MSPADGIVWDSPPAGAPAASAAPAPAPVSTSTPTAASSIQWDADKPAAPPAAPVLQRPGIMDHVKQLGGSLLQAVGSTVAGAGRAVDSLDAMSDPNNLEGNTTAHVLNRVLPQSMQITPDGVAHSMTNLGNAIGQPITNLGNRVQASESDAFKDSAAKPLVQGTLYNGSILHPSTLTRGNLSLGAGATDPTAIAANVENLVGQAAPLLAGGIEAKGAEAAAGIAEKALPSVLDNAPAWLQRAAKVASPHTVKTMAIGAAQMGEQAGSQEQDRIEQMTPAQLAQMPAYNQMVARGMAPADAQKALGDQVHQTVFQRVAPIGAVAGVTSALPLLEGTQGVLSDIVGTSRLKRAALGAALEAPTQGTVGTGMQAAQVAATNAVTGENRDPMADSGSTFLTGAVTGAGFGALGGLHAHDTPLPNADAAANAAGQPAAPVLQRASAPVQPAAPAGSLTETAQLVTGTHPSSDAIAASTGVQPLPDANAKAAPTLPPGPPPWMDSATGVVDVPSKAQLAQALADHMVDQYQAAGHMRIDPQEITKAWGVPQSDVVRARKQATMLASDQIAGTERAAMQQGDTQNPPSETPNGTGDTQTATSDAATDESATPPAPLPDAAVGNTAAGPASTASIPFMITNGMKSDLRGLGHTDAQIAKMTPEEAHAVIAGGVPVNEASIDPTTHETQANGDDGLSSAAPSASDSEGSTPASEATAQPAADSASEPGTGTDTATQPDTPAGAGVADAVDAADKDAAVASDKPADESQNPPEKEPSDVAQPGTLQATAEAEGGDGVRNAGDTGAGKAGEGSDSTAESGVSPEAPTKEAAAPSADSNDEPAEKVATSKAAKKAPADQTQPEKKPSPISAQAPVPALAVPIKQTGASRDAEGMRIKTPDGEITGKAHVDSLIKDGYTKVQSTRAGDKLVHALVNDAGEKQPIKARQLKYAEEATSRQPTDKQPLTAGQQRTSDLLGARVGDTIRTTGMGGDIQPGSTWKIDRIEKDGSFHTSSPGGGTSSFTRAELEREVKKGARFEQVEQKATGKYPLQVEPTTKDSSSVDAVREATSTPLDAAAHEAATSPLNDKPAPTEAQIAANNYEHGHIKVHGLDISVENPKGSTRSGIGEDGKPWSHEMSDHYGYVKGTVGSDGEHVDTYVGPKPESKRAFVVDQLDQKSGLHDEHKVMLGYTNRRDAIQAYKSNFDPGWKVGPVHDMTIDGFKDWLKNGDTTKPMADHVAVASSPAETKLLASTETAKARDKTGAEQQAAKPRGGIAPNGAKTRIVAGKLEYDQGARETLQAYFKPGDIVQGYAGIVDKVLAFHWNDGNWNVEVQRVNKDGSALLDQRSSDARPRIHSTAPDKRELIAKLGKPETLRKSAASDVAKPAAEPSTEPTKIDDLGEKIGGARKDTAIATGSRGKKAAADADVAPWLKRYVPIQDTKSGKWNILDSRTGRVARMGYDRPAFDSEDAASKAIPLLAVAQNHRVVGESGGTFAIKRDVTDQKRVTLKDGFPDQSSAMKYMDEHPEELLRQKTGFGEEVLKKPEKVMRQGAPTRTGDVEGKTFMDTYGFHGVEFGKWNNQAERQEVMNHAYDGLHDLSEVIGVPPAALSLNGDLGLAFGARGQGLSGARAHYERSYAVMNLTKMQGAGALAHEWFHALDHYLGRQDGKASSERVTNARGDMVLKSKSTEADYLSHSTSRLSKARPELVDAYRKLISTLFRKGQNYVEDTAKAEQFVGRARDEVTKSLDALRKDLSSELSYGNRRKPASPEQLAEFDKITEPLRNGQGLDTQYRPNEGRKSGPLGRQTNDVLEGLNTLMKQVRNRQGFNAEGKGTLDRLRQQMKHYSDRITMLESANKGDEKTKQVPTQYAMDAKEIDQGRASDYWTTNHEMAARAFSSYIEDKIAAEGGRSDFLSYGSDNKFYRAEGIRPFPERTERQALDGAFDHFFGVLKSEAGEDGKVRLFDKAAPSQASQDAAEKPSFSFAGERAATANRDELTHAQQMEAMGKDSVPDRYGNQPGSPDETHIATGWSRGADGKWRFEIDDSTAAIKTDALKDLKVKQAMVSDLVKRRSEAFAQGDGKAVKGFTDRIRDANETYENAKNPTMGQVLDHSALFEAYPDLAKVRVRVDPELKSWGSYHSSKGEITIRSPGDYPATGNHSLKSVVMHELQHAIQDHEGFARGGSVAEARTLPEYEQLLTQKMMRSDEVPGWTTVIPHDDAIKEGAARAIYQRLAGEVEARNTQERMGLDAATRRAVPPSDTQDTGRSEQIVRFNPGRADDAGEIDPKQAAVDRVKQTVSDITKEWKGSDKPGVKVVATPEDLPDFAKNNTDGSSTGYKNARGMYDGKNIYIVASAHPDTDAGRAQLQRTVVHEAVGHYGIDRIVNRELGADAWTKIESNISRLEQQKLGGERIQSVLQDVRKRYGAVDDKTFAQEALAVMSERGVTNGLLDRAIAAVRAFIRRIMPDLKLSPAELRQLLVKSQDYLQRGQTYGERVRATQAMAFSKDGGEKIHGGDDYRNQLDSAMKTSGGIDRRLPIGRTSDALKAAGLGDAPMVIKKDTVLKATRGERQPEMQGGQDIHDVRMADIQRLPELLDKPVMVMKSRTQPGAVVAITDAKDITGRPVVVALHTDKATGVTEVHRVASIYGKDGVAGFVREDLKQGRLLYRDTEKSPEWLKSVGLQLPGESASRGLWDSVPTEKDAVNGKGEPSPASVTDGRAPGAPRANFDKAPPEEGTNDRGEPDVPGRPRAPFSKASASIESMREAMPKIDESAFQRAKDWVKGKLIDIEPHLLGALQLRHVLELAGEDKVLSRPAKEYANLFQRMDGERNAMTMEGATKSEKLNKFAFEHGPAGWAGKMTDEAKTLFKFMHEVTQISVDPTHDYERLMIRDSRGEQMPWTKDLVKERTAALRAQMRGRSGDDKTQLMDEIKDLRKLPGREKARAAKYPELVDKWNKQGPQAKEMFSMMRDHYAQTSDMLKEATLQRIQALDIPDNNKRTAAALVTRNFDDAKVGGVYFPLSRFGDYWIASRAADVRDADGINDDLGGEYHFTKYENAAKAIQGEKMLRAAGHTIEASGKQNKNYDTQKPVTGTFMGQLTSMLKAGNAPDKVLDDIHQMFLRTLPELSLRKSGIHRKNVAGYTDNVPRVFASNILHGAHQIAKAKYGYQLQDTLEHMKGTVDGKRGSMSVAQAAHSDALMGELDKRHEWIMNPSNSKLATMTNAVGFAYYLSASPASAVVNLAQSPMITLPVLGARHGWPQAMKELSSATKDSMRTGGNIRRTLIDDAEKAAYDTLNKNGTFARTATHELGGIAEGDALKQNPVYTKVMTAMGYMFQKAEIINRESAGMAAFRLATKDGKNFNDSVHYADEIVNGTHFDYSNANRARYMQGNVQKVLFQFKNYALGMSWIMYRNLDQSMRGETPEIRSMARRTLTGILGMGTMFAGVLGTPINSLMSAGANAYHAATGNPDEPWDFNTEFRAWLGDHLGPQMASVIADGAVNQLGANVSSRLGTGDMWFRDADKQLQGGAAYDQALESLAGPIGAMTKNMFVGSQEITEGHTERGIEQLMPTFIKNAMKSVRFASEGDNSLRGDPIVSDVSGPQQMIQALGFQPTALAEQNRTNNALMNYSKYITDRRQALMNAYALAQHVGDSDGKSSALERIAAFNQANPEVKISMMTLNDSMRQRAKLSEQASNGIVLNKKLAGKVREAVGGQAAP